MGSRKVGRGEIASGRDRRQDGNAEVVEWQKKEKRFLESLSTVVAPRSLVPSWPSVPVFRPLTGPLAIHLDAYASNDGQLGR